MCVRMSRERSFLKSQWFLFSTVHQYRINVCRRVNREDGEREGGEWYKVKGKAEKGGRKEKKDAERTFSNTPDVLASFDDAAVRGTNVLCGTDDREWDGAEQHVSVLSVLLVVQRGRIDADALCIDDLPDLQQRLVEIDGEISFSYALFEREEVVLGERIGLCDDGDEIDTCAEALHDFNIQRLETTVDSVQH